MRKTLEVQVKVYLAFGVLLVSLCLWLLPSHVLELIAEQRHVLLGRYSVPWFAALVLVTPILWVFAYVLWASTRLSLRHVAFRVVALLLAVFAGTLSVDLIGRALRTPRYIETRVPITNDWPGERVRDIVRHRPPGVSYEVRYNDVPPAARSYPDAPPGYPPVDVTLTTDARGYRNRAALQGCDIVTVGDSFAEGSRVSDDEQWPVLVEKKLNRPLYNLGISGAGVDDYLNTFLAFGLGLKPKIAIVMIYEGNDFKGVELQEGSLPSGTSLGEWIHEAVEYSPVRLGLKGAFIRYLGPINADGPVRGAEILDWMPAICPPGPDGKYYSFKPKRLSRLYWTESDFRRSAQWTSTAVVLRRIKEVCEREKVRLIFAYAPSKPHVVMPLVRESVTPERLHAFASLKRRGLPPPEEFKKELYDRLGSQEKVLREFCQAEGIGFVSTTAALQKMAAEGRQVYYTYNQHWTAHGHVAVAEELSRYLAASAATGTSPPRAPQRP